MSAYGFSEDSAKRIVAAVRKIEGDTGTSISVGPRFTGSQMSVVKVTSLGTPYATGQRVDFDASSNTIANINQVKIKEVNGATLTVNNYYVGLFSGYTSTDDPLFLVNVSGSGGGGNAVIDVVTDVICTPTGIEVSTVTLSGADYDNAVIRQFLALSDVTPSSYLGNQGRVVKVNDSATGLEFGAIGEGPTYTTFIALSDTPSVYGTSNTYKVCAVGSNNSSIGFFENTVSTTNSIIGGGNPCSPSYTSIKLVNDTANPGNSKFYGTDNSGVKGWRTLQLTTLTDFPSTATNAGKFLTVNSGSNGVQWTAVDIAGMLADIADLKARVAILEGA